MSTLGVFKTYNYVQNDDFEINVSIHAYIDCCASASYNIVLCQWKRNLFCMLMFVFNLACWIFYNTQSKCCSFSRYFFSVTACYEGHKLVDKIKQIL